MDKKEKQVLLIGIGIILIIAFILTRTHLGGLFAITLPLTTYSDDFNRADGSLGPDWVVLPGGNVQISSQAVATMQSSNSFVLLNAVPSSSDYSIKTKILTPQRPDVANSGIILRYADGKNYYRLVGRTPDSGINGNVILTRVLGGTDTVLRNYNPITFPATIEIGMVSDSITITITDKFGVVSTETFTDTNPILSTGQAGFITSIGPGAIGNQVLDDWSFNILLPPTTSTTTTSTSTTSLLPTTTTSTTTTSTTLAQTTSTTVFTTSTTAFTTTTTSFTSSTTFQVLDTTTTTSTSTSTTTLGLIPTCGNGIIDTGEQCDGTDFGGKTCSDYGYNSGTLICDLSSCTIDNTDCHNIASSGGGGGGGGGIIGDGNIEAIGNITLERELVLGRQVEEKKPNYWWILLLILIIYYYFEQEKKKR